MCLVQGLEGKGKPKHEVCKSIAPLKLDPGETSFKLCVTVLCKTSEPSQYVGSLSYVKGA